MSPQEAAELMRDFSEDLCVPDHTTTRRRFREAVSLAIAALEREAKAEPVAWARRWYVDGVKPLKVKNENGRMVWAAQFHWKPVTETKLFPDDVALYASPPAPEIE